MQHRVRGPPQPKCGMQEVGLKVLAAVLNAAHAHPRKNAAALRALASALHEMPPLHMFTDIAVPRAPPERQLLVSEHEVAADSTKTGSPFAVHGAFKLGGPQQSWSNAGSAEPQYGWCSKARPHRSKSSITVSFPIPVRLSRIEVDLPKKLLPALIGLEILIAPRTGMGRYEVVQEMAAQSSAAGKTADWVRIGLASAPQLLRPRSFSIEIPHFALALRISFKGFDALNSEKCHALSKCALFAVDTTTLWTMHRAADVPLGAATSSPPPISSAVPVPAAATPAAAAAAVFTAPVTAAHRGSGGVRVPLYTDSMTILHQLEEWAGRAIASSASCVMGASAVTVPRVTTTMLNDGGRAAAAAHGIGDQASQQQQPGIAIAAHEAALDTLIGLSKVTGALSTVLALVEVRLSVCICTCVCVLCVSFRTYINLTRVEAHFSVYGLRIVHLSTGTCIRLRGSTYHH